MRLHTSFIFLFCPLSFQVAAAQQNVTPPLWSLQTIITADSVLSMHQSTFHHKTKLKNQAQNQSYKKETCHDHDNIQIKSRFFNSSTMFFKCTVNLWAKKSKDYFLKEQMIQFFSVYYTTTVCNTHCSMSTREVVSCHLDAISLCSVVTTRELIGHFYSV